LGILDALSELSSQIGVVVPLHPRTRKLLASMSTRLPDAVRFVGPLGYRDMMAAEEASALIITDSGGVQKEAFWLGTPCVTVRDETEWLETLESDRNIVVGADRERIVKAARRQLSRGRLPRPDVAHSAAGAEIVRTILAETAQ
jgi:UDP-GlcNAc3NAcA epimerase